MVASDCRLIAWPIALSMTWKASAFVRGLADGHTVPAALITGLAGIVVMITMGRWTPKLPAVLVAVLLSACATGQRQQAGGAPRRRRPPWPATGGGGG